MCHYYETVFQTMKCSSGTCQIPADSSTLKASQTQSLKSNLLILSAEISSQLTSFENGSFSGFTSLHTANLENCNLLTELSTDLFMNCYKLSSVILPQNGVLETERFK